MKFFVGTSGYGYGEWKGSFYPQKISAKKMLDFYGENFNSVELNNTFRKMPTAESLAPLLEQVPKTFQFVVKAPQSITHFKRLREADGDLAELNQALAGLKKQRGPVLFQLPPNFKKDLERLSLFLKAVKKLKIRAAFEFRHETWFDDDVIRLLRKSKCALCAADSDDGPKSRLVETTNWGYLRLRREKYSKKSLQAWLGRIKEMPWTEVFLFFKHEETGSGPRFAQQFLKLAGQSEVS